MHNLIELCENWSNKKRKLLIGEHNIKPLLGRYGIRLMVEHRLFNEKFVPVLNSKGDLEIASGWPQITTQSLQSFLESRQFQVRAVNTESGDEEFSSWFDKEEEAEALQQEIENSENYTTSKIIKRIKELNDDDNAEPTLKPKTKK